MLIREVVICALACATASAKSLVEELESDNYMAFVKKHETVLIDFWAPWCSHCKNMEPEFEAAALELADHGVVLAKMNVDSSGNRKVAKDLGIAGYPGLIIFSNGEINKRATAHVSRIRDADFFVHFMTKVHEGGEHPMDPDVDDSQFTKTVKKPSAAPASGKKALEITTTAGFNKELNQNDIVLVMFFAPWCGHCKRMKPSFAEASSILKNDDIVLAQVDATALQDLAQEHEVSSYPSLKIFYEGVLAEDYEGGRSTDDIVSYMKKFAASAGDDAPAAAQDACLGVDHAAANYMECCHGGNWKKGAGRGPVCKLAKLKL